MTYIRTAIFGGSFNPIHKGHIGLARQIIDKKLADEVWLLVSPQNPLKKNFNLMDENIRLKLAQTALQYENKITASDFEFSLPRPSYTWDTLEALRGKYPGRKFLLVIGADNWNIFDNWAHHEDILKDYPIIIYPRENCNICKNDLPKNVYYMEAPIYPYSSTEIRAAYHTLKKMLPENILIDFMKH